MNKKKLLIVIAAVFFISATPAVFAAGIYFDENTTIEQSEITFEEVELNKVPSKVTNSVKEDFPDSEITKTEVADIEGDKVYRFTLKKDGSSMVAFFTSEGKRYQPKN